MPIASSAPAGWPATSPTPAAGSTPSPAPSCSTRRRPTDLVERFEAAYTLGVDAHRHVHAANFGVRADAYAGGRGWLARTVVGEEHDLWRRLGRSGFRVTQPLDVAVRTSARRHGRVVGGFASWLARLEGAVAAGG